MVKWIQQKDGTFKASGSTTKRWKKKKNGTFEEDIAPVKKTNKNTITNNKIDGDYSTYSRSELQKEVSTLQKQVAYYGEEDNKLSLKGFWEGITGKTAKKLEKDKEFQALNKKYKEARKILEDKTVEEKEYKGTIGKIEKFNDVVLGSAETSTKALNTTITKIKGDTPTEEEIAPTLGERLQTKALQESKGAEKVILDVTGSVTRMLPQIAVGNPAGAIAVGFANYGGGAYNQARQEGYTDEQATKYGLVVGGLEMTLEKVLGGFETVYGKSLAGNLTNKVMGKVITNQALRKALSGMAAEGMEEYLQEFLEPIVRNTILEEKNGADFWNTMKDDFGEGLKQLGSQFFNKENAYAGMLGALTSGVVGAQSNIDAYKYTKNTGRDLDTGLTKNEQTVLTSEVNKRTTEAQKDKVLKEAIQKEVEEFESSLGSMTEAEKKSITEKIKQQLEDGEIDFSTSKLSKKELKAIEEQVRSDLEKGNIDVETIEDTLSGEITAQIKELQQKLDKTTNEQEKAQIQAKISELQHSKAEQMKSMLGQDAYLQKSYSEANKKSQKFFYEETGYESEYKKSLAKDFEKVANDTTKSHELFETLSKIAEDKQTNYGVINNEQLKKLGYDVEGKDVNGLVRVNKDGTQKVLINVDSSKAINRIVGHETTHLLEGTKEYTELQEMVKEYAETKGDYSRLHKELTKLYDGIDADIEAEVTAELVGDYLFTDEAFVNNLSTQKPTIFQKIYNEIKHLYKLATAGSKEARQLEKVKKAFDKAYKQNASNTSEVDTKYSVSDNQGRTLTKEQQEYFKDSKVRDENGNLLTVYHGSDQVGTTVFTKDKFGNRGVTFLTNDPDVADTYRNKEGKRYEFYADIKNPLVVDAKGSYWGNIDYFEDGSLLVTTDEIVQDALNGGIVDSNGNFVPYDGVIFKNVYDRGKNFHKTIGKRTSTVYATFSSNQIKNVDNTKPTSDADIRYSLSEDSEGNELKPTVQNWAKNSKARDENGHLKVLYHGTATGEFTVFDKSKASPEGDWGAGFYLTDNGYDVETNYEDGGPDFDGKIERLAERIESEEDISYEEAKEKAKEQLYKGSYKITSYVNMKNPAIVGKTYILDGETTYDVKDLDDYDGDIEGYYQDLIYDITEDIQYNVEVDGDIESLSNILWNAVYDGGIEIQQLKEKINELYLTDYDGNMIGNEVAREILEYLGYDGIIDPTVSSKWNNMNMEEGTTHYIAFKPNQIKSITNENPTDNPDINLSLSQQGEQQAPVRGDVFGSDIKLQVEEAIAPLKEEIAELKEAIDPEYESTVDYSAFTEEEANERDAAQNNIQSLTDEEIENEVTQFDFLQQNIEVAETEKAVKEVISRGLGLNARETNDVYKSITAIEDFDIEDVKNAIEKHSTSVIKDVDYDLVNLKKAIRETKLDINYLKATDKNFKDKVKYAFGSMRLGNSGQQVDSFYQEMSELYPEFLPNDINNEADMFDKLLEISKLDPMTKYEEDIPEEFMDRYANEIYKTIKDYQTNEAINNTNKNFWNEVKKGNIEIPAEETVEDTIEEIAPVVNASNTEVVEKVVPIKEQLKENSVVEEKPSRVEQQTAQILDEKPTPKNKDRKLKAIATVNLIDKGYYISKLARETNNRQLDALWDNTLLSNAQAQEVIGEGRFKFNEDTKTYDKVGNSVYEIFEGLETTNKVKDFNEYMYHKLNVERMSLEDNAQLKMKALKETTLKGYTIEDINAMAKTKLREDAKEELVYLVNAAKEYKSLSKVKNKPVFGYTTDANKSIEIVTELEQNNPEFSDYAKKVYDYESGTYSDLSLLVESGILSQEDANYYRNKYESYVPIMRDVEAEMMEKQMFGKRVSVGNAVKSATGGNQNIIPLKDAMAIKTMLVQRSANMNKLGLELMYALNPVVESETVSAENIIEDISNNKDLIQAGTNGKAPTMTVYEHGVKHTFEIPQEIYEALKPNYDSASKITIKPLNAFSNFKRNVLTQYNPFFMVTNMIKDAQDVLINSQHPASTYKSIPEAIAQLSSKGYWYKEMQAQGLFQDTYYDNQGGFDTAPKGVEKIGEFYPLKKIAQINDFIERVPRMAEYIASRKAGRSIEVSSLDASRVTTNFKAGGDWTKFFNRNGATFLNASVQGALQQVRNVQEAHQKGLKGYMGLATKFAVAALPAVLLNGLLWDDDEEYEELSDYIKDNYYIIGKYGDGQFIRIPKGRMTAVIQKTIEEMQNLITGDGEVDLGSYLELVVNNVAPSNPIENNIFTPFINTKLFNNDDAGKTWYGEDLVPTRLQSKPAAEQYDETTDEFSKWLGEKLNLSPIKINNLLDQNTGVIGDLLLPMMTAEAKTKNDNPIAAGIEDKFTADVVFDNKYSSDFYSVKEDLAKQSNSYEATDKDILKTKYMNSKQAQMNDIYAEIREVQNSDLDKETKYAKVRDLRKQLNDIAESSLNSYNKVKIESNYSKVGEIEFRKSNAGEWEKITGKQLEKQNEVINTFGVSANDYWSNKKEYDYAVENPDKYKVITQIDTFENYSKYKEDIDDIKEQYKSNDNMSSKQKTSLSKQRKAAVQQYIDSLSLSVPQKIMLENAAGGYSIKSYMDYMYPYIESLPISAEEKQKLHNELFN